LIYSSLKISASRFDNVSFYQRDSADCEDLAEEYWGIGIRKNDTVKATPTVGVYLQAPSKVFTFRKNDK